MNISPQSRILLIAVFLTLTSVSLARLAYGLVLPAMRISLDLSVAEAGNLGALTSFGYLLLLLPAGAFAARYGPRRSILCGMAMLAVMMGATAVSDSYLAVMLSMSGLGVGTAFVFTPLMSLLVACFPSRRGMAIGVANSGIGIGMALCGVFVPQVIESQGASAWRMVWASYALIAATAGVLAYIGLPNPHSDKAKDAGPQYRWNAPIKIPATRIIAAIYGLLGGVYLVQSVFTYSFATASGIDEHMAGLQASVMGGGSIVAGAIGGVLSDRLGRAHFLAAAFFVLALATALPAMLPNVWGFWTHYLVLGLVLSGVFSAVLAAASESVPSALVPLGVSFVTLVFAVGQFLGPMLAGGMIEFSGGYHSTYLLLALALLGASGLSWHLRKF